MRHPPTRTGAAGLSTYMYEYMHHVLYYSNQYTSSIANRVNLYTGVNGTRCSCRRSGETCEINLAPSPAPSPAPAPVPADPAPEPMPARGPKPSAVGRGAAPVLALALLLASVWLLA